MQRHMLVYLVGFAMSSSLGAAAEAQSTSPAVAKQGSAIIDPRALAAVGVHATPGSDSAARRQSTAVGTKAASANFFATATGGAERPVRDLGKFSIADTALPAPAPVGRQNLMNANATPRTAMSNADERMLVGAPRATAPKIAQESANVPGAPPARTVANGPAARANPSLLAALSSSRAIDANRGARSSTAIGAPAARANPLALADLTSSRATDANQGARSSTAIGAPATRANPLALADLTSSRATDANRGARSSAAVNPRAGPVRSSIFVAPGAARQSPLAAAQYGPLVHGLPARKLLGPAELGHRPRP
jgi:hypothetical protein